MTRFAGPILFAALCAPALSATAQTATPALDPPGQAVSATPTFSQSPQQSFPRLSGLADTAIQAQVNKQLANRERIDRGARTDCLRSTRTTKAIYSELVRLSYLSPRLLSVDVRTSFFCGGSYTSDNVPYPITFDLATGHELDWNRFFTAEFLNPPADKPSPLLQLYLRYAKLDEECTSAVNDPSTTFDLWLDSSRRALIAHPSSLPHSSDLCAKLTPIPFTELKPYLRDPLIRQELLTPHSPQ
jgi:hypothetical protein